MSEKSFYFLHTVVTSQGVDDVGVLPFSVENKGFCLVVFNLFEIASCCVARDGLNSQWSSCLGLQSA